MVQVETRAKSFGKSHQANENSTSLHITFQFAKGLKFTLNLSVCTAYRIVPVSKWL